MTTDWQPKALCAQTGGDWWYADKTSQEEIKTAKTICEICDVQTQCLETALANDERFGIWGGLTPEERIKIRRLRGIPPRRPYLLEPCGTTAAARRHRRRNEPLCPPCSHAIRQDRNRRRNP